MNQKRLNALIKGCKATTKENVVINPAHAIEVLSYDTCEVNNLFNWVVEAEATEIIKPKPGSVIPPDAHVEVHGLAEVNRELLLELLEDASKQQARIASQPELDKILKTPPPASSASSAPTSSAPVAAPPSAPKAPSFQPETSPDP